MDYGLEDVDGISTNSKTIWKKIKSDATSRKTDFNKRYYFHIETKISVIFVQ